MNELVWEGLLEVLREGQPSLKASAHLWRRDDHFGSDWGGQLELPVVFRRLLPAEEYVVRLPAGTEARVRLAAGPSTTTMTFPTVTGIGDPPFGTVAAEPETDDGAADRNDSTPAPARARTGERPRATRERRQEAGRGRTSNGGGSSRRAVSPEERPPRVADPADEEQAVEVAPPIEVMPEPVVVEQTAPPPPPAPIRIAAETQPAQKSTRANGRAKVQRNEGSTRHAAAPLVEVNVEQTEALARAFLAAIEARDAMRPLERPGFAGRAILAARQDVEHIASTLEAALRASDSEWHEELRGHLAIVDWFASLAAPDDEADIAAAGRAVQDLLSTIESELAIVAEERVAALAA